MSRPRKMVLTVMMFLLIAGCDTAFEQVVVVKVLNAQSQGVRDISLRYYSAAYCSGSYVAGGISSDGEARFSRKAVRGGVSVLLEKPSICAEQGGSWYSAWQRHIDPANQENFVCRLEVGMPLICERLSHGGS